MHFDAACSRRLGLFGGADGPEVRPGKGILPKCAPNRTILCQVVAGKGASLRLSEALLGRVLGMMAPELHIRVAGRRESPAGAFVVGG